MAAIDARVIKAKKKLVADVDSLRGAMSILQACKQVGVSDATYYKWRNLFQKEQEALAEAAVPEASPEYSNGALLGLNGEYVAVDLIEKQMDLIDEEIEVLKEVKLNLRDAYHSLRVGLTRLEEREVLGANCRR